MKTALHIALDQSGIKKIGEFFIIKIFYFVFIVILVNYFLQTCLFSHLN